MSEQQSKTGFVWHELYMWHDTGRYAAVLPSGHGVLEPEEHAENTDTKRRIKNLLDVTGMTDRLVRIDPRHATREELLAVHTAEYLDTIKSMSDAGGGDARITVPYGHSPFGPGGFEIATLSAGGVIEAVDAVLDGRARNAYALVRPPGHHAEPDTGLGFCMLANASIAARRALTRGDVQRIAMVDWDVHHGNGAQRIFWEDPNVLTISVHQDRCFPPGSGPITEIGAGPGRGYNINIPLPPGSGVGAYEATFDRVVVPALHEFQPDLIIVPSGLDAGALDPLARMMLHSECFRMMTRKLKSAAESLCGGRLALCHEGGYHKSSTPYLALAIIEELSGIKSGLDDPFMPIIDGMGQQELQPHQDALIAEAEQLLDNF